MVQSLLILFMDHLQYCTIKKLLAISFVFVSPHYLYDLFRGLFLSGFPSSINFKFSHMISRSLSFYILTYSEVVCGGLVVRVSASTYCRSPVPGSNLGPGPPHSAVLGAADRIVKYCINNVLKALGIGEYVKGKSQLLLRGIRTYCTSILGHCRLYSQEKGL